MISGTKTLVDFCFCVFTEDGSFLGVPIHAMDKSQSFVI